MIAPRPGRSAARSSCGAVRCRAGAVTNADAWSGPGSAERHEECRTASGTRRSIILQQPLDVVEFELRALGVAEAAAQFFEDAAHPLHVDLAGDLHREIVAEFAAVQGPAQGIAVAAAALLAAGTVARTVVLAVAVAGLHLLRQVLRALAQGLQRLALRVHRAIGISFAEPAVGVAHCIVGIAEIVLAVAIVALLALVAVLALLTLLALLAL